jgi:hypothetical protein
VTTPRDLAALEDIARDAAPAPDTSTRHLTDAELQQLRGDVDEEAHEWIFRHVASCASCRARMLEPRTSYQERVAIAVLIRPTDQTAFAKALKGMNLEPTWRGRGRAAVFVPPDDVPSVMRAVERLVLKHATSDPAKLASPGATDTIETEAWRRVHQGRPTANDRGPRQRRSRPLAWAAAAVLLALAGVLVKRGRDSDSAPLVMTQRSFVGMMGEADAARSVASEDRDLELSLQGAGSDEAALLVVDGEGRQLAPPVWFTRAQDGRLSVVVAPRGFAPHEGPTYGLALVGTRSAVEQELRRETGNPMIDGRSSGVRTVRTALAP